MTVHSVTEYVKTTARRVLRLTGAPNLKGSDGQDFAPRHVVIDVTDHHDGDGPDLKVVVSGLRILARGGLGKHRNEKTYWGSGDSGLPGFDPSEYGRLSEAQVVLVQSQYAPDWLREVVAQHLLPSARR